MSKNLRVKWSVVLFLAVVISGTAAYAQEYVTEPAPPLESAGAEASGDMIAGAARIAADVYKTGEKAGYVIPTNHGCVFEEGTLSCNQTRSGTVTNHGCVTNDQSLFFNFYTFTATAGQRITISATSSVIDPLVAVFNAKGEEIGSDDDGGDGLDSLLTLTMPSAGQFGVGVYAVRTVRPATGSYTISLTCSSTSSCTANSTTLCLNNGRFKVQTRWATTNGQSGDGNAVAITGDTGYFWFFSSTNVEMVLKVLNACPSRYWVFAGGLTNVQVTMTVTDTSRGTVKTYTNAQGVPFQPIQDTNAFATCP